MYDDLKNNLIICSHDTYFFPPLHNSFYWVKASSLSRLQDHTQTHHMQYDSSSSSSGRVIGVKEILLPDNT
jgi:hypothetical protein